MFKEDETQYCKNCYELQQQLDQLKAEREKIKAICENHFDEYEMGCLDLSDAIESLLERYDNAITRLMKDRKELKADNEDLKESLKLISQTLNHTLQGEVGLYKRQIDNSVPDDWEYEEVLVLIEEYIEKLKAEVKSKTEYIQEQRDIINQYSKEIEMYKKCQGKRASKREEELKAENEHLSEKEKEARHYLEEAKKFKKCLTEIKEIADPYYTLGSKETPVAQILQKISECEGDNEN